jgi:hypothetical protein
MKRGQLLLSAAVVALLNIGCEGLGVGEDESESEVSDCTEVTPTYTYTVVDTNQTTCYDSSTGEETSCTDSGQDGAYEGVQPSYSLCNDDTVVVDNNTGLMWQSSSDTDGKDGIDDDDKMTKDEADTYCSDLTYGTYSDWRLPTVKEQYSIYLMSGQDISGITGATSNGTEIDYSDNDPFIDTDYFDVGYGDTSAGERAIDGQYASATENVSQMMSGISNEYVNAFFGLNYVDGHLKSYELDATNENDASYYVRCVRGNEDYGTNSFTNNGDDTVTDSNTGLMWQQEDSAADDFEDAIDTCENATTGSHSDWRLPNAKELHSIVDYTKSPEQDNSPSIDTTYFNSTSFTNEAGDTDWGQYWSSTALLGYTKKGASAAYITFGRALGYIDGFEDVHGAGAQRSDYKELSKQTSASNITEYTADADCTFGTTAYTAGPQGDIKRANHNYVRCVRDAD